MQTRKTFSVKRVLAMCCIVVWMLGILTACGGTEKKLVGTWDASGYGHIIELYSDKTYKEVNEYGTGKWTVLDGNTLKLTNFYGETITFEIEKVTSDAIVFTSGGEWTRVS